MVMQVAVCREMMSNSTMATHSMKIHRTIAMMSIHAITCSLRFMADQLSAQHAVDETLDSSPVVP